MRQYVGWVIVLLLALITLVSYVNAQEVETKECYFTEEKSKQALEEIIKLTKPENVLTTEKQINAFFEAYEVFIGKKFKRENESVVYISEIMDKNGQVIRVYAAAFRENCWLGFLYLDLDVWAEMKIIMEEKLK